MNDIKQLAAITALNDMMSKGYFCICTIDKVAKMLGINARGEAYDTLSPLHCVHFDKMPQELRDAIPGLIHQILSIQPTYQFTLPARQASRVVATIEPEKPRGFLQRLRSV
jgi:hypothetical protein